MTDRIRVTRRRDRLSRIKRNRHKRMIAYRGKRLLARLDNLIASATGIAELRSHVSSL